MKVIQYGLSILATIGFVLVIFITCFEWAMYSDYDFYREEYRKYQVVAELDMTMQDTMHVTKEMMEYLRGNRKELSVMTTIEGENKEFFNEKDRFHMYEVQQLFLGGLRIRTICIGVVLLCMALLAVTKCDWKKILPRGFFMGGGTLLLLTAILGVACAIDFNGVFLVFHKITFDNTNWIFDPKYDYMIRMLPEGLFYDMVMRIGMAFIPVMLVIFGIFMLYYKKKQKITF